MARLLVVVSVEGERAALSRSGWDVVIGGVGQAAAAAVTSANLISARQRGDPYGAVLCAGIAGGFAGRAEPGATVLASRVIAADLGADSPDGFLPLDRLGFASSTVEPDVALLHRLREALPYAIVGEVLTVATVTGTTARAAQLLTRHPHAVAEAMEGFGVATAATLAAVPFAELRTISNRVGPRDVSAWRIPDALAALGAAGQALASLVA